MAYLTKELNDMLNGQGKQVRVLQQAEEAHFLSIFQDRLVIHHVRQFVRFGAWPTEVGHL